MSSSSPFRSPSWPRLVAGVLALGALVSCEVGKLFQDGGSDPAAARLEFAAPPNGTAGEPLSPAVRVSAIDSSGSVDTAFHGTVTLTLGEHPEGAALRGTRILDAVRGVASFADLRVNRAGKGYRLTASAGQLAGATSDSSFDITAAPPTTGDLTVNATTTGDNQPGSYTVKVDEGLSRTIAANGAGTTYSGLPAGDHVVALTDVPTNCTVSGGASQTATVPAGGAATAAFTINCTALTGSLAVTTSTTGPNAPSGYTVTVDRSQSRNIGPSDNVTYTSLATGNHAVQLNGVPSNCTVSEANPQTVTVPPGGSATAAFTITCTQLTGSVTVTTSTSGGTPDSNGYTVTVTGGGGKNGGTHNTARLPSLATGSPTPAPRTSQSTPSPTAGAPRPP